MYCIVNVCRKVIKCSVMIVRPLRIMHKRPDLILRPQAWEFWQGRCRKRIRYLPVVLTTAGVTVLFQVVLYSPVVQKDTVTLFYVEGSPVIFIDFSILYSVYKLYIKFYVAGFLSQLEVPLAVAWGQPAYVYERKKKKRKRKKNYGRTTTD
jgi:hypothetical protein